MTPPHFKFMTYLILAGLILMIQPWNIEAQTKEKASGEKNGGWAPSEPGGEKAFQDSREGFLKKEYQKAAAEIRRGAAFLDKEAELATEAKKKTIIASARELDQFADRERKGAVHSVQELERVFARAEHALAEYSHSRALESWYGKAVSDAGRHLKAAAVHLENALNGAGQRLEAEVDQAIREGKEIGEKMEKGSGWVDAEGRIFLGCQEGTWGRTSLFLQREPSVWDRIKKNRDLFLVDYFL